MMGTSANIKSDEARNAYESSFTRIATELISAQYSGLHMDILCSLVVFQLIEGVSGNG
jgi:hypothetical protein